MSGFSLVSLMLRTRRVSRLAFLAILGLIFAGCSQGDLPPPPQDVAVQDESVTDYIIGPLDQLQVYVWRSEDLSAEVAVRPDGRITMPLIGELQAAGKTVSELTQDISDGLSPFVQTPVVSITVVGFGNVASQSIKVVGEVGQPASVPYQRDMNVLDVMVAVGGLSEFAAGNEAVLIRGTGDDEKVYRLRLDSLLTRGDLSANAPVLPGDVILIPKSFF